ncbi:MAG TPA: tetratricopeptide repeat protein [Candidatus Sulfotelmatobacter sp.]
MKPKLPAFFLFFLATVLTAQATQTKPVGPNELMAWLAAGISNSRLTEIAQQRGLTNSCSREQAGQFEAAGAAAALLRAISTSKSVSGNAAVSPFPPLLLKAASEAKSHRFHEAELYLRSVVEADPQNSAYHYALGNMLMRQELWDDAFDEITLAAKFLPDLPENHNSFAYIFYRLDDGPNAIAEARTALSMDPQNAEAYQFLGLALYSNGQYAAAAHALDESLARDAGNPDTYYDLGITLHAAGDQAAAITAYRQAIRSKPSFWEAHSNLGLIWHEENRLDDAIAEYREAQRLAPEQASVRNNLGNTYCDKADFDSAINELQALYREHPEWQQGHGCLARAYMAKKEYGAAIGEFKQAVLQNPISASEHRMLGQALVLNDQLEDGVHELRLAVTLNPDSEEAHHFLGTALFQQQQTAAAEKEFREALRLNSSAENHYSLAACLMTLDRYDEALAELDAAARLAPERTLYRARREELMKLINETNSR